MIVTCPNCSTCYSVDPGALGPAGKTVRCSNCAHQWVQRPPSERFYAPPLAYAYSHGQPAPRHPADYPPPYPVHPPRADAHGQPYPQPSATGPAEPRPAPVEPLDTERDGKRGVAADDDNLEAEADELPDDAEPEEDAPKSDLPDVAPVLEDDDEDGIGENGDSDELSSAADDTEDDGPSDRELDDTLDEEKENRPIDASMEDEDDLVDDPDDLDDMEDPEPIPQVFTEPLPKAEKKRGGTGLIVATVFLSLILGLAGGVFLGKDYIVKLYPPAAKYLAMVGLRSKFAVGAGLRIRNQRAAWDEKTGALTVSGLVSNVSEEVRMVPMIKISLTDIKGGEVQSLLVEPDVMELPPLENMPFQAVVDNPDGRARGMNIELVARSKTKDGHREAGRDKKDGGR